MCVCVCVCVCVLSVHVCRSCVVAVCIPLQLFPARACWLNVWAVVRRFGRRSAHPVAALPIDGEANVAASAAEEHAASPVSASTTDARDGGPAPSASLDRTAHLTMSALLCGVVFTVAYNVDNLGKVFEVVGATASTSMCYTLPGFFVWALFPESPRFRAAGACFGVFGLLLMVVSLVVMFVP
jgi:hypothetical protein